MEDLEVKGGGRAGKGEWRKREWERESENSEKGGER